MMHLLEILSRLWERAAPMFGVLLCIFRLLTFFLVRKPEVQRGRLTATSSVMTDCGRHVYFKFWGAL